MILDQIAWVDCFVFLAFLAPQLLLCIGFFRTAATGLKALPYLLLKMPYQLVRERYFTPYSHKSPFVQHCTLFQDVVIRCVRYAFAEIPADIGRVFLSKPVSLPFLRFRIFRNGVFRSPIYWREINRPQTESGPGLKGVFVISDETRRPDIVIYYCHGGGFSMGSSYFYMEFLLAWIDLLRQSGFDNPALFALEYTLVPEATYPTQIQEAMAGYKYVLSLVDDSSRICVAGDSAGGTLVLSMLLCLSDYSSLKSSLPGLAVLISPWTTIISPKNKNTPSDYLNAQSLHLYGSQYIGSNASVSDPMVSPGSNDNLAWWRRASPELGWLFIYGAEEVFASETEEIVRTLRKAGADVHEHKEEGWIHAWPVVKLFLCTSREDRQSGLKSIVSFTRERLTPVSKKG